MSSPSPAPFSPCCSRCLTVANMPALLPILSKICSAHIPWDTDAENSPCCNYCWLAAAKLFESTELSAMLVQCVRCVTTRDVGVPPVAAPSLAHPAPAPLQAPPAPPPSHSSFHPSAPGLAAPQQATSTPAGSKKRPEKTYPSFPSVTKVPLTESARASIDVLFDITSLDNLSLKHLPKLLSTSFSPFYKHTKNNAPFDANVSTLIEHVGLRYGDLLCNCSTQPPGACQGFHLPCMHLCGSGSNKQAVCSPPCGFSHDWQHILWASILQCPLGDKCPHVRAHRCPFRHTKAWGCKLIHSYLCLYELIDHTPSTGKSTQRKTSSSYSSYTWPSSVNQKKKKQKKQKHADSGHSRSSSTTSSSSSLNPGARIYSPPADVGALTLSSASHMPFLEHPNTYEYLSRSTASSGHSSPFPAPYSNMNMSQSGSLASSPAAQAAVYAAEAAAAHAAAGSAPATSSFIGPALPPTSSSQVSSTTSPESQDNGAAENVSGVQNE